VESVVIPICAAIVSTVVSSGVATVLHYSSLDYPWVVYNRFYTPTTIWGYIGIYEIATIVKNAIIVLVFVVYHKSFFIVIGDTDPGPIRILSRANILRHDRRLPLNRTFGVTTLYWGLTIKVLVIYPAIHLFLLAVGLTTFTCRATAIWLITFSLYNGFAILYILSDLANVFGF
jgi:hypothetical protein